MRPTPLSRRSAFTCQSTPTPKGQRAHTWPCWHSPTKPTGSATRSAAGAAGGAAAAASCHWCSGCQARVAAAAAWGKQAHITPAATTAAMAPPPQAALPAVWHRPPSCSSTRWRQQCALGLLAHSSSLACSLSQWTQLAAPTAAAPAAVGAATGGGTSAAQRHPQNRPSSDDCFYGVGCTCNHHRKTAPAQHDLHIKEGQHLQQCGCGWRQGSAGACLPAKSSKALGVALWPQQ